MQSKTSIALIFIAVCALFMGSTSVFAHDGHGLQGTHWHATDVGGFVGMFALVALAVYLSRGKK